MKQYTRTEFIKILKTNNFEYTRNNGSHSIFTNSQGKHISVPLKIRSVIARRLIRENKLKT